MNADSGRAGGVREGNEGKVTRTSVSSVRWSSAVSNSIADRRCGLSMYLLV